MWAYGPTSVIGADRAGSPSRRWLYLTSYIVLLGAEINAESERQTRHDTTTGEAAPMGERGAAAADEVATAQPG